jgi:hypothetical protein
MTTTMKLLALAKTINRRLKAREHRKSPPLLKLAVSKYLLAQ